MDFDDLYIYNAFKWRTIWKINPLWIIFVKNKKRKMKKILATLLLGAAFAFTASAQDTAAAYPGGKQALDSYITKTIVYPAPAKENGVEGVVGVSFVVKADGKIGNIKIRRMVDPDLEAEAVRIVKSMPAWTPAKKDGVAVDSTVDVDIPFTLE